MTAPPAHEKAAPGQGSGNKTLTTMRENHPRSVSRQALDRAKESIGIADLWRRLGLPGEPKPSCCSPFREDRHPSFSISSCGRLWKDHATGEGGDGVSFIERATGSSTAEAIDRLVRIAGTTPPAAPRPTPTVKPLRIPTLTTPTLATLVEYQAVRRWPLFGGMEIAHRRGNLFSCTMPDDGRPRPALAMTDSARRSVQVRAVDGLPWAWNGAKAWTLGGSLAGWPIGCTDIGERPIVALCEGGPDCLSALTLAYLRDVHDEVAAVFMPGASAAILPEALAYFAGKRVRIYEHADKAGADAGPRWAAQLTQAGAVVDGLRLDPPHKDLADVLADTDSESLNPPVDVFAGLKCP